MGVYQLTYMSAADPLPSDQDLIELLAQSRRRNLRSGLTGLLLYYDGAFIQAIEGEREAVDSTYARIQDDIRHVRVRTLTEGWRPGRDFTGWEMGFVPLATSTSVEDLDGFTKFVAAQGGGTGGEQVHRLLDRFREIALNGA